LIKRTKKMSDGAPFGTQQHFQPGKTSVTKGIGSMVSSASNKLLGAVRGDRALRKQYEFAAALHAHNEGISHHYAMERQQAGHEQALGQIREQGYMDRLGTINAGQVGRQNIEHAANVASGMKDRNVSMETGAAGEVKFSSVKAPTSRTAQPAKTTANKATAAKPPATSSTEETPSVAKPPTTRTNARAQSQSKSAAKPTTPSVTKPRKATPTEPKA
jgi:hypothetical protein